MVGRVLRDHNCRSLEEVGSSQVVGKGGGGAGEIKMGREELFHPHLATP